MAAPSPATTADTAGARKVLLIAQPVALLQHMEKVVRTTQGAVLAGSFNNVQELVDWATWEGRRSGWQVAYVDEKFAFEPNFVQRLQTSSRGPGTLVAIVDHLWREVRERCAAIGIYDIVERGDLIAFQDNLEKHLR
jgi:hypothetical protein